MQIKADSPEHYIEQLPDDRKVVIRKLRKAVLENLPKGFTETMNYGMIGYVVPHSLYPAGYYSDPKMPVPFINIASQKNYVTIYHMGIYSNKKLSDWFINEYIKLYKTKPDMGKGCIRFKKLDQIPYDLIGELSTKITASDLIKIYESHSKK
jgi:uncharacterized protein YdhG (YjbR/CyaY superfamily)